MEKKRDKQKEKKMMKLICADEAQARKIKPINLCCWCNESACGSWVTCFYFHSSQNGANSSFNIHTHHAIYFLTFSSVGFFWWASETLRHFLRERRCKMRNRTILPIIWVFQFFFFLVQIQFQIHAWTKMRSLYAETITRRTMPSFLHMNRFHNRRRLC